MNDPTSVESATRSDSAIDEICVFDIGAAPEGPPRWNELAKHFPVRVIGFEPENPAPDQLPYFIGDGKEHLFRKTRYFGCSSLFEPNPRVINKFRPGMGCGQPGDNYTVVERKTVSTIRLDDVDGLPQPDMLKLDTQGSELMILENATRLLANVTIIEVEVEFVELYEGQPLFADIDIFLRSKGFEFHRLIDIAGRCFTPLQIAGNPAAAISQFIFADAVYVRNLMNPACLKVPNSENLQEYCIIATQATTFAHRSFRNSTQDTRPTSADVT